MKKVALITGITGQDGSYLAELLLEKGYEVHGIVRRASNFNTQRIDHIFEKLNLHYGDVLDPVSILNTIAKVKPDELYNLAAQSHVKVSFECPVGTSQIDGIGFLNILEAVRICGLEKKCRIYQASTSEMYGNTLTVPQNEKTKFCPTSPYACAKLFAHNLVQCYRDSYGMFICSGILFNHESPRRDPRFVTRKVTRAVARYITQREKYTTLELGNLEAKRDWGFAGDYVRGMWLMLQQAKPDDYCLATGVTLTVRELVEKAFALRGVVIKWKGKGVYEVGIDKTTGNVVVKVVEKYFRPSEVHLLLGDYSHAKRALDWRPECTFEEMLQSMISIDE